LKTNLILAYKDFTNLPVWQRGFRLVLLLYEMRKAFPDEEKFGLVSDMRRAGNSVIHNIAEGFGRFENKDKSRFYKISRGSSYELISQTLTSNALGFLSDADKEVLFEYKEIINELDLIIKTVELR